jgi:hypothetical protein
MKRATQRQADRIARALNAHRTADLPKFWAQAEHEGLYIGIGDDAQYEPGVKTWEEAEQLIREVESGRSI